MTKFVREIKEAIEQEGIVTLDVRQKWYSVGKIKAEEPPIGVKHYKSNLSEECLLQELEKVGLDVHKFPEQKTRYVVF